MGKQGRSKSAKDMLFANFNRGGLNTMNKEKGPDFQQPNPKIRGKFKDSCCR